MLTVKNLSIGEIVRDISFNIAPGQRVGLIGESGSGKTLTALSIMQLLKSEGEISLSGKRLDQLDEKTLCTIRGKKVAMVFQEPMTALNPLMKVGNQIAEAITIHTRISRRQARAEVAELLTKVELDPHLQNRYPHELSGGQRQRVLIAMALAHDPELLICDEPTTALDVTSQRAIIELIRTLVRERGTGLLFISHDLKLVAHTCEEIMVMRKGTIVETGSAHDILNAPRHEYTQMLLAAAKLPPARPATTSEETRIQLTDVSKTYGHGTQAVAQVDLQVRAGERLGLVGGSGSGKTTTLKMIAGLIRPTTGSIEVNGSMQMIFQDPMGSLNPRMRIKDIVSETLASPDATRVAEVLTEVGLDPDIMDRFPHQFSGGQRQRISIARALAPRPDILLADEPVSALDVSVRKKILLLLDELVAEHHLTLVFVSHDIGVVASLCSSVAVMLDGRLIEHGSVDSVLQNPQHSYTQALIDATS